MNYFPLNVKTHFSLLRSPSQPNQIANHLTKLGLSGCAIIDDNLSGCVQFIKELKEQNLKPIIGLNLNIFDASTSNIVLIAKNYTGWKKLVQLSSEVEKPENKFVLSINQIRAIGTTGLICITGHVGSHLHNHISGNRNWKEIGIKKIIETKELFEDVFLSINLLDNTKQNNVLANCIRGLGKLTHTRCVAMPISYYLNKSDSDDQKVLLALDKKTTLGELEHSIENGFNTDIAHYFHRTNFYLPSNEEILQLYEKVEIENTNRIADLCEEINIFSNPILPPFSCPNNLDADQYLRQLCREGFNEKGIINYSNSQTYIDRIKQELQILQGAKLSDYFLIVKDILDYVKSNNWLVGPGRGSAAGCLVSYLVGITQIDPIKYNLLFERFYNAGRNTKDHISLPDIDFDIPKYARAKTIQYITMKYGIDRVAQIVTFQTMKGRAAMKDILRVYGGISFDEMNAITKYIPDEAKIADELQEMKEETGSSSIIQWTLENRKDKIKNWCYIDDDNNLQGPLAKRFAQAIKLEKTKVNRSIHAAGIIIGKEPLSHTIPMISSKDGKIISGLEGPDCESLGLPKLDCLGISSLDKIMGIQQILRGQDIKEIS